MNAYNLLQFYYNLCKLSQIIPETQQSRLIAQQVEIVKFVVVLHDGALYLG